MATTNTVELALSLKEIAVLRRALELYSDEQKELRNGEPDPHLSELYGSRVTAALALFYKVDGKRKELMYR